MGCLLAVLAALHGPAFGAGKTPQAAAEAFYGWVLSQPVTGLPTAVQRQQLRALLTPEFVRVLEEAEAAEKRCVAGLPPDIKGNIWEGSLFVSNYEGADEVWYGAVKASGRSAVIAVDLLSVDPSRKKGESNRAVTWRDSVKLRKSGQDWLVADVMRGVWPGPGKRESLVGMLRNYIDVECPRKGARK